ncbi:OsmC family protein [Bizionia sp.]|uniref:OsmC family protein n=1 Tax=Bizionia sp. TaxID=1954480 RepID=UPI003A8DB937
MANTNKVITHWKGNLQFESDNPNGKTVLMDTSPEHGGHSSGLSPKAMMLSALAGCSGLDVVSVLDKMKVQVSDFRMDTYGELTDEHPKYYHTVSVEYHFYGDNLDENKIKKAVDLSVEKYCGVMEMFRKFATVKTSIHYHNK